MADHSQSLFDDHVSPGTVPVPDFGYLVTNHLNLMYMLSAGLIMPPSGFGGKYYQDSLGCFPGWIPLFIDKIFNAAVEASVCEATHLRPCLAQVRLDHLAGPVWALREEDIDVIEFPAELNGTERVIFVPAPLPTLWIERIVFQSQAEVTACNKEAQDYNNVPWTDFQRKTVKRPFNQALEDSWPPTSSLSERTISLATPFAAGGSVAMLLYTANRGNLGVQICRLAFEPNTSDEAQDNTSILAGFGLWLRNGTAQLDADMSEIQFDTAGTMELQRRLYWGIVDRVAHWKSTSNTASPEDIVLDYLEEKAGQLHDRLKQKVMDLRDALEDLTGLGAMGTTEMFERFPTPFSRALTLFFLRQDCGQLLEFQHSLLTEEDWLAAALLFGARSGWQELPLDLRNIKDMAPAISHLMASIAQQTAHTNLELGTPPTRPRPLREAFMGDWTRRHQEAARTLAQRQGWDCLQTTIDLSNGHYELRGKRSGIQIVMDGEPAITYTVDQDSFFQHLANERIVDKAEQEVYKILRI